MLVNSLMCKDVSDCPLQPLVDSIRCKASSRSVHRQMMWHVRGFIANRTSCPVLSGLWSTFADGVFEEAIAIAAPSGCCCCILKFFWVLFVRIPLPQCHSAGGVFEEAIAIASLLLDADCPVAATVRTTGGFIDNTFQVSTSIFRTTGHGSPAPAPCTPA